MIHDEHLLSAPSAPTNALAGVDIFEESGIAFQLERTVLARMSPSSADRSATQLLGADHILELALAHIVDHFTVARSDSVVWKKGWGVTVKDTEISPRRYSTNAMVPASQRFPA